MPRVFLFAPSYCCVISTRDLAQEFGVNRKAQGPAKTQHIQPRCKTHLPYDKMFCGTGLHVLTRQYVCCSGALTPNLSSQALLQNCSGLHIL